MASAAAFTRAVTAWAYSSRVSRESARQWGPSQRDVEGKERKMQQLGGIPGGALT